MTCHRCQTAAFKFGFHRGFQRYRCRTCGQTFTDLPDKPLDNLRVDFAKAVQVVRLLTEGCGIRAVSRLTGLHQVTVLHILETVGFKARRFLDDKIRNVHAEQIQTDEVWCYVGCKAERTTKDDLQRGDQFVYLSVDRASKLIINFHVGKRESAGCHVVMQDLKQRVNNRFQLSTDNFGGYRGRTGAVGTAFGENIDFAVITKQYGKEIYAARRYSPPVVTMVKKTPQIGEPDQDMICTSHVERQNLNVRLFNRRFTRLTMGFSRKLENLKHSVALSVAHWDFCWRHNTTKQTPAQASGLADHVWTVEELLTVLAPY